jgi:hypothetical protein
LRSRWPGIRSSQHAPRTRRLAALLAATAAAAVLAAPLPARAAPAAATAPASASAARPALVTQAQAMEQARVSGSPVAVTAATTDSSTLTANPDGTLTATVNSVPVRKNVAGKWLPLDATLHQNADGSVSPAVTSGTLQLSGGGTGALAATSSLGHTLSVSLPVSLPAPVLSGPTATYADVYPGVDLVLTVDAQGGYDYVLVVKNAAAASNPALQNLAVEASATGDVTFRNAANGDITAVDSGGRLLFDQPAPTMWDSRPMAAQVPSAVEPGTGQAIDLRNGQALASGTTGPGENARRSPVGARYSGGVMTYTPDLSLLAGTSTDYPVYIDPWQPATGINQPYWAQADSTWPSQTYPKPSELQVGYEGWPYTDGNGNPGSPFTARSFTTMTVPPDVDGSDTQIHDATLYLMNTYAPTCDTSAGDFGVQVWRTGTVNSSAIPTWTSQNPSTFWVTQEKAKSFAHGYSGCSAASEGFDVHEAAGWAAQNSKPTVTFGIRADSESDKYGWKKFDPAQTYMTINYDKPPTISNLGTSPATTCSGGDTIGQGDVQLYATVGTPLGANSSSLTATFHVTDTTTGKTVTDPATGLTFAGHTGFKNNSKVSQLLTEANLENYVPANSANTFSWYATNTDGTLTTSTQSTPCTFTYDRSVPGAPSITPQQSTYAIGTKATFTVTPAKGSTVGAYVYQLNGETPSRQTSTTITVIPSAWSDQLTVTALSPGGNVGSQAGVFQFNASAVPQQAEGDLTGDAIPDLVTPGGGTTGLAPGLWLAAQGSEPGQATGNGTLSSSTVNLGQFGDGITSSYSPSDFTGAQVITGAFTPETGRQDALAYYPAQHDAQGNVTLPGHGAIAHGNGDGTPFQTKDASNSTQVQSPALTDVNNDQPLQVANGYNADPNNNSTNNPNCPGLSYCYPDLITITGDTIVQPDGSINGYHLEYFRNSSAAGDYGGGGSAVLLPDLTPDNQTDWNDWQITSMTESSGAVDLFLYKPASGPNGALLYLWQNFTITNDTAGTRGGADTKTSYLLSSNWQPVPSGSSLTELRAASITGSGPALWAVSNTGTATAWTVSGLPGGTPAIAPETPQSLLSPSHAWRLGDQASGAITATSTAADNGTAAALPFSGHGGVSWNNQNDLYAPSAQFDGSTGFMTTSSYAMVTPSDYSVSAWVKPTVLGGVVLAQTGNHTSCMVINIDTTTIGTQTYGRWNFRMSNADSDSRTWATATAGDTYYVKLGAWTHLTVTYSAANNFMRLYVNGIPAAAATPSAVWGGGCNTFTLGRYLDQSAIHGYFSGKIADVQVWRNVAMTPTETAAISGNPDYNLFPSDGHVYASASGSQAWQWQTACGNMNFYQGQINIQQTCTGTTLYHVGTGGCSTNPTLALQGSDGNLVIRCNGTATWASGTSGNTGDVMFFQPDGNLVIYNSYGKSLWASGSQNAAADS